MKTPEAIISDADGTLVNTLHLIRHGQYETSKAYLTQSGIAQGELPDYKTYEALLHQTVGASARDTLEKTVRLLYQSQPHHLKGLDFDALHDMLNPVQDRIAPEFVSAYDGLSELLIHVGSTSVKLAIVSSGTPHHIVRNFGIALPEIGLTDLYQDKTTSDSDKLKIFEATVRQHYDIPKFTVVTCEDTATHKPNPESYQLGMQRLDVLPVNSLILGDHKFDMEAAIRAGVPQRVGITRGFDDRSALVAAGATQTVDSLTEFTSNLTN